MGVRNAAGALLALVLACTMQGCAREDGSRLLGHWRAERFEVMGLKLPIGPALHITRDKLASDGGELMLPIAGITEDDDEVTVDTEANIGLTFYFVEPDRMYVKLPFVERIYYRRVSAQADLPAAHTPAAASTSPLPAERAQGHAPVALPAPAVAAPVPLAPPAAPGALAYGQALAAVRAGDDDRALRDLHEAFEQGFTGAAQVADAPQFARLRGDVRFQVLLARYTVQ
jgi:hypothetical protein